MEKFELNKRVIARMERPEMASVKGGISVLSCERGSRMDKRCCKGARIDVSIGTRPKPYLTFRVEIPLDTRKCHVAAREEVVTFCR